jgi:hypothetical protein
VSEAATIAAADWIAPTDGLAYDSRVMDLLLRLAEAILHPIGRIDESHCRFGSLNLATAPATSQPFFARALNALVAREAGLDALDISPGLADRLNIRSASRLSALLAASSKETLQQTAIYLSAAALHPRIVLMPHKEQRLAFIAALGVEGYELATREAPLQFRRLGELAPHAPFDLAVCDAAGLKERFIAFGMALALAFVEASEKELATLIRRRWPTLTRASDREIALSSAQCDLIIKLCARRFPSWRAIIG